MSFSIISPSLSEQDLHLLMVTPRFIPHMGGVESHVLQVGKRLVKSGVHVTVLTTDLSGKLPTSEWFEGMHIRRVRAYPARQDLLFAPGMWKIITGEKWSLIHIQSYHTLVAPLAMLAALKAKIPYVVTFHGGGHSSQIRNSLRWLQQFALSPLLRHANRLVAIAKFEIDLYASRLHVSRDLFTLIPNGNDLGNLTDSSDPMATEPEKNKSALIASVGRLEKYKGHHRIIAAMPEILTCRPDARLWIAGQGPYEPELHALINQLDLADKVEIRAIPPQNRAAMAEALQHVHVVVLLSEYETHPIAVLEAISLGCSVLVADNSGMKELSDQHFARAIPLNSPPDQVAQAVLNLLDDPLVLPSLHLPTWDDCAAGLLILYKQYAVRIK